MLPKYAKYVILQYAEGGANLEGFIIQNRHNRKWHFSASLSYCPRRRLTRAFVHGLTIEEMNYMAEELSKCRERLAFPTLLLTVLVETRVQTAIIGVRDCHREIIQVEVKTGLLTKWDSSKPLSEMRRKQPLLNLETIDFNTITADITSVTSKLAYTEYLCEFWTPKLIAFDRINNGMLEAASAGDDKDRLLKINRGFQDDLALLRSTLEGVKLRAGYTSKRAQAQVQTVSARVLILRRGGFVTETTKIFSLIAQKDNAIALRDNAHLKTIAEEQKRIALAASQDSASMQIISVITAVFLPATFAAVGKTRLPKIFGVVNDMMIYRLSSAQLSLTSTLKMAPG